MKKTFIAAVLMTSLVLGPPGVRAKHQGDEHARPRNILTFETMYGVDGPFLGEANAIRGVIGDELPWTIKGHARGKLVTNGHLKVRVQGLVFTDDPEVPPDMRGKNDETQFRALVSCVSEEGESVVTRNVTTGGFAATDSGNSTIDTTVALPQPCVAPIVFILAGSEDKWFAVSGFEAEE